MSYGSVPCKERGIGMNTTRECVKVVGELTIALSTTVDTAEQLQKKVFRTLFLTDAFTPQECKDLSKLVADLWLIHDRNAEEVFDYIVPYITGYMTAKKVWKVDSYE